MIASVAGDSETGLDSNEARSLDGFSEFDAH